MLLTVVLPFAAILLLTYALIRQARHLPERSARARLFVECLEGRLVLTVSHLYTAAVQDAAGELAYFAVKLDTWGVGGPIVWDHQQGPGGPWGTFVNLGSPLQQGDHFTVALVAAQNQDGTIVLVVQNDLHVVVNMQTATGWSGWADLGAPWTKWIDIARNGPDAPNPNSIEIFALSNSDGRVYSDTQTASNTNSWQGFAPIDGGSTPGGGPAQEIVAAQNGPNAPHPNTLEVFALGQDNLVYQNAQTTSGGSWGGWSAISSAPPTSAGIKQIVVGQNGPNAGLGVQAGGVGQNAPNPLGPLAYTLEVFALGNDNVVYQNSQVSAGGYWGGWGSLGTPYSGTIKQIAVAQNGPGAPNPNTLEVFALGSNNLVYQNAQTAARGAWGGWGTVASTPPPSGTVDEIAVAQNSSLAPVSYSLEVFTYEYSNLTGNDEVYQNSQTSQGGAWGGWGQVGSF